MRKSVGWLGAVGIPGLLAAAQAQTATAQFDGAYALISVGDRELQGQREPGNAMSGASAGGRSPSCRVGRSLATPAEATSS